MNNAQNLLLSRIHYYQGETAGLTFYEIIGILTSLQNKYICKRNHSNENVVM